MLILQINVIFKDKYINFYFMYLYFQVVYVSHK